VPGGGGDGSSFYTSSMLMKMDDGGYCYVEVTRELCMDLLNNTLDML
jgi:hypothetical protein